MSDSEQKGRCRQQLEAWYANNSSSVPRYSWMVADAIDRLAADVEAIKAKVDAVSPEDVKHFVESEKAWVALVTEQRDEATRKLDAALAEVERLKAIVHSDAGHMAKILIENERLRAAPAEPPPAGNSPKIPDSSPAAPQPASPAPGWLTDEERELLQSRLHALRVYLRSLCKPAPGSVTREVEIIDALLARAGSPPVVVVPALGLAAYRFDSPFSSGEYRAGYREACFAHRHAMDKAGVAWKEVPRE